MKYLLVSILTFSCTIVNAQKAISENFNIKKGVAIEGYDPVSYFKNNPKEGSNKWQVEHNSITYYFSSESNLEEFRSNPDKYEPKYGGWCAYAMGDTGEKVKIDPDTYKIINGKLYLFYNFWGTNTLTLWNKSEVILKPKADNNWSDYLN